MGTTTGPGGTQPRGAVALGLAQGNIVQELGWDSDVDDDLRQQIMDAIDADMVEEPIEAVDIVLLWWREEDGDLVDGLVDALRDLSDTGSIWLLTPKVGRTGYVDPADIQEATLTAGLALANPASVSREWQAQKIVRPKHGRR
ncbi:DUF3052 domain-containing protein [Nigerium massiliense]|uniref:DUF3052 domain-containing protein n=1 Tax=Nigerium massiliense TaxID=1522317 RepID=UPI000694669E